MFWNKNKIPNVAVSDENDNNDLFGKDLEDYMELEKEDLAFTNQKEEDQFNEETKTEDEEEEKTSKININIINKIVNISLIIIIVIATFIFTDVIAVTRLDKGPFFAIKTKTYDDGGSREYYGLFYKVIKYKETNGRVDTVIGSWKIQYDNMAINTTILDLAIEFNNDFDKAFTTYMDKYLKVTGEISKIEGNTITLKYREEEASKYNTTLKCTLLDSNTKHKVGDEVTILGILYNCNNKENLKLYMKNCSIKK